ncbi:hypothetical protein PWT90_09776 [Aphanocladium album]|nr:hypothetical protein PWT90_09776 [Aphanocladium album]
MGSVIQIGDAIKFAEIAWKLYEYGWARENNAGESYRTFGEEVHILCLGLQSIDSAFQNARDTLIQSGARGSTLLRADRYSLAEIIGDYESTIHECRELLKTHRHFNQTTGPFRNIQWSLGAMRQVEALRRRIHMHNLQIQHVLTPFKMDLISTMHQDLARRVMGVDTVVREIRDNLDMIIPTISPEAARTIHERSSRQPQPRSLDIPDAVQSRLEDMFARARGPTRPRMSLKQLTECFVAHLEKVEGSSQLNMKNHNRTPPGNKYLELLKCQFLLQKIKVTPELIQAPQISHWHSYIKYLEEKLSTEASRFDTEPSVADIMSRHDEVFMFHLPQNASPQRGSSIRAPSYDLLLHLSLDMDPNADNIKSIQLLRRTASETQFRIIETLGYIDEPSSVEPKVVDFNTSNARLLPRYAYPVPGHGSSPPLEIILEENGTHHTYRFATKADLWEFQAALTGYKVAYMESHAKVEFVRQGRNAKTIREVATIQLWRRHHINGAPIVRERERLLSLGSRAPSVSSVERSSRAASVGSAQSSAAAGSSSSWSSVSQADTRAVHLDNGPTNTSHAVIRSVPSNPLLVLFTVGSDATGAPTSALVSIKVSDATGPNRQWCACASDPNCRNTVIQQLSGRPTFKSQRLDDEHDLLHLPRAREMTGLLRLHLEFATADARRGFSGGPCRCARKTFEEESKCLTREMHQGYLGVMSLFHARQMKLWQKEQDKKVTPERSNLRSTNAPDNLRSYRAPSPNLRHLKEISPESPMTLLKSPGSSIRCYSPKSLQQRRAVHHVQALAENGRAIATPASGQSGKKGYKRARSTDEWAIATEQMMTALDYAQSQPRVAQDAWGVARQQSGSQRGTSNDTAGSSTAVVSVPPAGRGRTNAGGDSGSRDVDRVLEAIRASSQAAEARDERLTRAIEQQRTAHTAIAQFLNTFGNVTPRTIRPDDRGYFSHSSGSSGRRRRRQLEYDARDYYNGSPAPRRRRITLAPPPAFVDEHEQDEGGDEGDDEAEEAVLMARPAVFKCLSPMRVF